MAKHYRQRLIMTEEKSGWDYISTLKETHTIIAMTVDPTYVSSQGASNILEGAPVAGLAHLVV